MELYMGGYGQGKKEYVLAGMEKDRREKETGNDENRENKSRIIHVIEGENWNQKTWREATPEDCLVFHNFHLWVRQMLIQGEPAEEQVQAFCEKYPDAVIICDEVGNGIVPMEPFEREYRERLGRILIRLAKDAERVERIICGMGQRIK